MQFFIFPQKRKQKQRSLRHRIRAAYVGYLSPAAVIAIWAALIPYIRDELMLDNLEVGRLLLCFGAGSIAGMLSAAPLTKQLGSRLLCTLSFIAAAVIILGLSLIPPFVFSCSLAFLFGMTAGQLEVGINIYGVALEREYRLRLMAPLHAYYSAGELLSAACMLIMLSLNLSPPAAALSLTAIIALCALYYFPCILNFDFKGKKEKSFMLPTLGVAGLSLIVLATYMVGGAMVDWSGIYLTEHSPLSLKQAVLGYLLVSGCMLICRIYGNRLIRTFGSLKTAAGGALLMVTGLALLYFTPPLYLIILAFVLIGFGMSNITPLAYSAAGRQREMLLLPAVSIMSTAGYGGLLTGPALLGFIAYGISLEAVFGFLALMTLVSFSLILLLRRYYV